LDYYAGSPVEGTLLHCNLVSPAVGGAAGAAVMVHGGVPYCTAIQGRLIQIDMYNMISKVQ